MKINVIIVFFRLGVPASGPTKAVQLEMKRRKLQMIDWQVEEEDIHEGGQLEGWPKGSPEVEFDS